MMRRTRELAALVFLLLAVAAPLRVLGQAKAAAPLPPAAAVTPQERLAEGRAAYGRNDFEATKRAVGPLVFPDTLLRAESDVIEAHKLLALSHFFLGERVSAEAEFLSLLQLSRGFELDVLLEPRPVIDFFEDVKRKQRERLYELEQRRREEAERAAREAEERKKAEQDELLSRIKKTTVIEKRVWLLNLVPFGAGQFQNGHRGKAISLLTTQLALAGTSVSLWSVLQVRYYSARTPVPAAQWDEARAISVAQLVSGGLFWVDVLAGVIDSLVCYRPSSVRTTITAGRDPPRPFVTLTPLPLPSGGGLSLTGVF